MAGVAYATQGDFDNAERMAREATQLDPAVVDAHVLLGQVYVAQKNNPAARKELEKALALDPSNPKAMQVLQSLEATPAK